MMIIVTDGGGGDCRDILKESIVNENFSNVEEYP